MPAMPIQMVCGSTPALVSAALRDTLHSASTANGRMAGASGAGYGGTTAATTNGSTGGGLCGSKQQQQQMRRAAAYDPDEPEFGEQEADDLVECISQSLRPGGKQMKPITYEEGASLSTSLDQLKSKYIVLRATTTGDGANGSQHSVNTATNRGPPVQVSSSGPSSLSSSSAMGLNGATKFSSQQSMHGKMLSTTNLQNGVTSATAASPAAAAAAAGSGKETATLPTPKRTLFPREDVLVGWKTTGRKWHVGAGMINMGNTCYLNSILQALFHVPAIANWLLGDVQHRERCDDGGSGGSCIICAMAKTLIESQSNQSAIKPYHVYSKLRLVCKHLVPGRQEDAHEFLRYLVEAMEKSYLGRYKNSKELDQYSKETTPLNQILGGYLRSEVRCPACHHVSTTFQHFEDLLLDIRKANSIDEALEHYFARERLEENSYKCEACKRRVAAMKQFSLERAPFALCVQLKRFSVLGGKINKHVELRSRLDLTSYSSPALRERSNGKLLYRLTSMVTHLGTTQNCGHYTAIGHTDAAGYHQFDDSHVRPIGMHNVTTTNAYILFYELESPVGSAGLPNGVCRTKPSATVGQPSSTATLTSMGHLSGDGAAGSSGTAGKASANASPARVLGTGGGSAPAGGFFPSKLEQKPAFIGPVLPTAASSSAAAPAQSQSAVGGSSSTAGGAVSPAVATNGSSGSKHTATDALSSPSSNASTLSNVSPLASPVKQLPSSLQSTTASVGTPLGQQQGAKTPQKLSNTTTNGGGGLREDNRRAVPLLPSMPKLALTAAAATASSKTNNHNAVVSLVPYETDDDSDGSSCSEDGAGKRAANSTTTTAVTNGGTKRPHKQTSAGVPHYGNGLKAPKTAKTSAAAAGGGAVADGGEAADAEADADERQEMGGGASRSPQIIKTKTGIWKVSKSSTADQLSFPDSSSSSSGGSAPSSKASSPATSGGSSPSTYPAAAAAGQRQQQQNPQRNGTGGGDATASALTNGHRTNGAAAGPQQPLNGGGGAADKRKPMATNGYHQQANGGADGAVQMLLKLSHRGYGAPVKSWDGQETAMDRELATERREERKRQLEDDREQEMDRGRVKKSKAAGEPMRSASNNGAGFAGNPFQAYQNGGGKWGGGNRNGGNHHYGNHHQQNNSYRGGGGGAYYSNGNGHQRHYGGGGGGGGANGGFRNHGRRFGGRNGGGGNFHAKAYHHHQRSESSGGGGGLASGGGGGSGSNGYYHR